MKKRMLFSMFMVVMLLFSGSGLVPAQAKSSPPQPAAVKSPPVPGELIVGFAPGQAPGDLTAQANTVASSIGATVLQSGLGGMSLLKAPDGADINALAASLKSMPGVKYVEPNYTVKLNDPSVDQTKVPQSSYVIRKAHAKNGKTPEMAYPIAGLKAAKTKSGSTVKATYPNDPSVFNNWGWSWVGADIVWNNTTASKNVCLIDTGVDYTHPDLAGKIIKGFDFVNYDTDPMDDYGHGTHVAGILAAVANNGQGIAGVSTGKVVAVKVLDANGYGTDYDVAQGIYYCANLTGSSAVSVLSLSLGGDDPSTSVHDAIDYAVNPPIGSNRVGKLVVAAAGNSGDSTHYSYPAYYSTYSEFSGKVLAVGAEGYEYQDSDGNWQLDQNCQASYTSYGAWVTFVAPGTEILSTTPWSTPFTLMNTDGVPSRYAFMSGTSFATPFVAATAAHAWGYKPTWSNTDIENWLYETGFQLDTDPADSCWDSSMSGARLVNVASALERGAITLSGEDANTDLPMVGATVSAYWGTTLKGSGVITYATVNDPESISGVDTVFTNWADIINLPTPYTWAYGYLPKISLTNFTASAQAAFVSWTYPGANTSNGVTYTWGGNWSPAWAYVPEKSPNFDVIGEALGTMPYLVGWLPSSEKFIVSPNIEPPSYEPLDVLPFGSLSAFPFARWLDGDSYYQSIRIRNRPAAAALPYYSGTYQFGISDGGSSGDPNTLDNDNAAGFAWKDGVIKYRVDKAITCNSDKHWWHPFAILSGSSGSPSYNYLNSCDSGGPY